MVRDEWDSFISEVNKLFPGAEKIENRIVDGQSVWNNEETGERYTEECYAVLARYTSMAVLLTDMPSIRRKVCLLKQEYDQDAIAVMVGQSELW